jgi:molybdenum cofactor cytidylyltransferase
MSDDRSVGAVIVAAGASRRYGSPKQLAMIDGRTMLEHAIAGALTASLAPVVAVVPVWLSPPPSLDASELRWIRNPFPERGLSLSLQLGLDAVGDAAEAALILLGDQPSVKQSTIAAVLAARGQRPVVAAEADGILAPPILIERSHFHLVEGLRGDIGLRGLLLANPTLVQAVPVTDHAPDVDTPEDLGRILDP